MIIILLLLTSSFFCYGMEKSTDAEQRKKIVKTMLVSKKSKYERALESLSKLEDWDLDYKDRMLLKKMATKKNYAAILPYAFKLKSGGLHKDWPLASNMLVEAIDADADYNARTLLELGVNPNCTGEELLPPVSGKRSPLTIAIRASNCALVALLLDKGADPNCATPRAHLPLMEAFKIYYENKNKNKKGAYEILHELLECGANPRKIDQNVMPSLDEFDTKRMITYSSALDMARLVGDEEWITAFEQVDIPMRPEAIKQLKTDLP